jgi:hypothetical protein
MNPKCYLEPQVADSWYEMLEDTAYYDTSCNDVINYLQKEMCCAWVHESSRIAPPLTIALSKDIAAYRENVARDLIMIRVSTIRVSLSFISGRFVP